LPTPAPAPSSARQPASEDDPAARAVSLRRAPKAWRWAKAAVEVGLSPQQVARLREAVVVRDASLEGKTAIVTRLMEGLPLDTVLGDDDEWTTLVYVGAIEAADAAFDERVRAALSPAQWDRWVRGGWSRAFGVRLPHVPRAPGAPTYDLPRSSAEDAPPRWAGLPPR
jgi:hypothetical protein